MVKNLKKQDMIKAVNAITKKKDISKKAVAKATNAIPTPKKNNMKKDKKKQSAPKVKKALLQEFSDFKISMIGKYLRADLEAWKAQYFTFCCFLPLSFSFVFKPFLPSTFEKNIFR